MVHSSKRQESSGRHETTWYVVALCSVACNRHTSPMPCLLPIYCATNSGCSSHCLHHGLLWGKQERKMHCLISDFSAIKAPFYTESTLKWLWEGRSKQLFGCLQCPFKHVAKRSDGNHSSELCSDMLLTVCEKKRGVSKFVRNNKMQPFIILYAVFESCIDTHRAVCMCTVVSRWTLHGAAFQTSGSLGSKWNYFY